MENYLEEGEGYSPADMRRVSDIAVGDLCTMPEWKDCRNKQGAIGYFYDGKNQGGKKVKVDHVYTEQGNLKVSVKGQGFTYTMLASEMLSLDGKRLEEEYSLTF